MKKLLTVCLFAMLLTSVQGAQSPSALTIVGTNMFVGSITKSNMTPSRVVVSDGFKKDVSSTLTAGEADNIHSSGIGGGATASAVLDILNQTAEASVASATTANIGAAASDKVLITGTTPITAFDSIAATTIRLLRFQGVLTLTHSANLSLPNNGANITTAANDTALAVSFGGGVWRIYWYQRANGTALVGSGGGGGGSPQTPWGADEDASGFKLLNLGGVTSSSTAAALWYLGDGGTHYVGFAMPTNSITQNYFISPFPNTAFGGMGKWTMQGSGTNTYMQLNPAVAGFGGDFLSPAANEFNGFTTKGTPSTSDVLLIEDAASGEKKKITIGSLPNSGGGGSSTPRLTTRHWRMAQAINGGDFNSIGVPVFFSGSSSTILPTATDPVMINYATDGTSGFSAGFHNNGNSVVRSGRNIFFETRTKLQEITATRFWAGIFFSSISSALSTDSNNEGAGFRFSTVASDTNFKCVSSTGLAQTITDSGIAADTATHMFTIVCDDTVPNIKFYIDGALVATHTTNLIPVGDNLQVIVGEQAQAAAVKNIRVGWVYLESDK